MMKKSIKSEVIYCENVKPSSPTPPHLKTYKLSLLDQMNSPSPSPIVWFFANQQPTFLCDDDHKEMVSLKTDQLKSSLSPTLTQYYPIAGRASADCQSIDCNDEGVPFYVATIKGHTLADLHVKVKKASGCDPDIHAELWCELVPCPTNPEVEWGPGCNAALIQVTHFDCGGVAIALVFWHKVADFNTMASFLKYWAASCCAGAATGRGPNYAIQSLFPPKDDLQNVSSGSISEYLKKGNFSKKLYVFDGADVRSLRAKAALNGDQYSPTRFQVITALIWKCFMAASLANEKQESAIIYTVNLRGRTQPPLPSESFGNLVALTSTSCIANSNSNILVDESLLGLLVKEVRAATRNIDDEYINRMRGEQGFIGLCYNKKQRWREILAKGADFLGVSSLSGMGIYDIDFGGYVGTPWWCAPCYTFNSASPTLNSVLLFDTKLGNGVEAWVTLEEKYMREFKNSMQKYMRNESLKILSSNL